MAKEAPIEVTAWVDPSTLTLRIYHESPCDGLPALVGATTPSGDVVVINREKLARLIEW